SLLAVGKPIMDLAWWAKKLYKVMEEILSIYSHIIYTSPRDIVYHQMQCLGNI
ncbi:hypothetical protein ACJX0J_032220, partial [Zea mays]